jgi:6-phosphogluconolactonase (cycloisomerase 2 family)
MKIGRSAQLLLMAAAPVLAGFLAGCGNFWQAPGGGSSTSFTLANGGNITVGQGATGTSTITVTPGSSFTGTVTLTCAVTAPSGASNATTCSLSPTSLTFSTTTAQQATLTATTAAATTLGAYEIAVTGVSGSVAATTTVCAEVTTTSGSCSAAASTSGNFYVLNQSTDQIAALNISSGKLNTIGTVTLPAPAPLAIAMAPNGLFLYVGTGSGIYLYTIGSNGALTLGNGGVAIVQDQTTAMQVDSTNSWLVEAVSSTTQLYAIHVISTGANAGTLVSSNETKQPFTLPAATPTQLAISPGDSSSCADCYIFVGMGAGGTEFILFNPANTNPFGGAGHFGVLFSGGDNAMAVDPSNRLLYVGESDAIPSATNNQTGGLRVFTIANAGLTELTSAGSPYAIGGTGPSAILPTSDGKNVYVANRSVSGSSNGNIAGFSVSATSLTSIGTVAAGPSGQLGLAEDSTGSYLLAVDFAGNPDLEAYTISSGTLTSVLSVATGTDPVGAGAIAAAP